MQVYVDESGDPGLKISEGSSRYFTIVLLMFEDSEIATVVNQRLNLLRVELGVNAHFEFKFNKLSRYFRESFFKAVAAYDFFYHGICINKEKLWGEGFRIKESFYKYATKLAFLNAQSYLANAEVFLDGCGDHEFRMQLKTYLRKNINQHKQHLKEVKLLNSKNSNLIQMSDMIAGALNRSLGDKEDAKNYRKFIAHREIPPVQIWPRE